MSKPNEERDIYYIPPNFLASGRLFGGMIRARNAIEACVLVLLTGIPIIKLPMSLTVRITMLKECISEYKRGKGRLTTGEYPTDPVA